MKIICINNKFHFKGKEYDLALTIGKEYDANIETYRNGTIYYLIINDCKQLSKYSVDYFNTKEAIRNQKLEDLGI
jgi:hypothetical protein